jgi:predicted HD phosphohydrolase
VIAPALSVHDIERVLAAAADRPVEVGDGSGRVLGHTHLAHALQTAALLRAERRDDDELVVAGLVHDLGHLLDGVSDETHAEAGAAAVRTALGERVAAVVGLHVAGYGALLSADSTASMTRQGPMTRAQRAAFERLPWAEDAVALRRADDAGKVLGVVVGDLDSQMPALRRVAGRIS